MKTRLMTVAALLASTVSAHAVGLDRSGQPVGILFQQGNHAELSFGFTKPSLSGAELIGTSTGNVGDNFRVWSGGVKVDLGEKWSFSLSTDEPYGADTFYEGDPATTLLGGVGATVDSYAVTALARYKFNDNWSVHGGLRYQEVSAVVTIDGLAFNDQPGGAPAGIGSYEGRFGSDGDVGAVIGASYEIPAIALRVSLTYSTSTTHDLPTSEVFVPNVIALGGDFPLGTQRSVAGATTEVETPESINLDFQTGIAPNTLLFGTLRWADYDTTEVAPDVFSSPTAVGAPLTDLETGFDFSIGVGRRFNEKWSGSVSAGFTTVGDDSLVSPLGPNNGSRFIAVGAKYDVNESFAVAGGVRYTLLGSATAAPGDEPAAEFEDASALSAGLRFEYKF
ncbi:MAG: outer membrane protein transport protein [Pseudomonadota bacterium]